MRDCPICIGLTQHDGTPRSPLCEHRRVPRPERTASPALNAEHLTTYSSVCVDMGSDLTALSRGTVPTIVTADSSSGMLGTRVMADRVTPPTATPWAQPFEPGSNWTVGRTGPIRDDAPERPRDLGDDRCDSGGTSSTPVATHTGSDDAQASIEGPDALDLPTFVKPLAFTTDARLTVKGRSVRGAFIVVEVDGREFRGVARPDGEFEVRVPLNLGANSLRIRALLRGAESPYTPFFQVKRRLSLWAFSITLITLIALGVGVDAARRPHHYAALRRDLAAALGRLTAGRRLPAKAVVRRHRHDDTSPFENSGRTAELPDFVSLTIPRGGATWIPVPAGMTIELRARAAESFQVMVTGPDGPLNYRLWWHGEEAVPIQGWHSGPRTDVSTVVRTEEGNQRFVVFDNGNYPRGIVPDLDVTVGVTLRGLGGPVGDVRPVLPREGRPGR